MSDVVERLRQIGEWTEPKVWEHDPTALEAAKEIEWMRDIRQVQENAIEAKDKEIERLREELERIVHWSESMRRVVECVGKIAKEALQP